MTSSPSVASLDFPLQSSRWLRVYLCAIHAVPVLLVLILPVPFWAAIGLMVAAMVSAGLEYRRQRSGQVVTQLQWHGNGWRILGPALDSDAQLQRYWLRPWGLMLHFEGDGTGVLKLLIVRDQLDAQSLRRLRVMVIHGGLESAVDRQ